MTSTIAAVLNLTWCDAMTLQDIYDQLAFGELRQVSLGYGSIDANEDGMPVESFMKLLPTVKLGLTELHKRFSLREGRMTVPLVENQVTYVLTKKKDAPDAFQDDLHKVERILGKDEDGNPYEIPLNRMDDRSAIRTTSYNTLVVPTETELAGWLNYTTELEIVYRADHPAISVPVANAAPLATEIHLPSTHLEALLWYIASRVHNPIGLTQEFHEGNNYAMKFENACQLLTTQNYEIDDDAVNFRVIDNGWR